MRIVLDIPIDEGGPTAVKELLDTLIRIWGRHMRRHPLPPLYSSVIRFRPDPRAGHEERWRSPVETFEEGFGDCDQLTLYRAAELFAKGENATAQCLAQRSPIGTKMHVLVRRGDGRLEDPSILLMRR